MKFHFYAAFILLALLPLVAQTALILGGVAWMKAWVTCLGIAAFGNFVAGAALHATSPYR